jgi:hypothetical protein
MKKLLILSLFTIFHLGVYAQNDYTKQYLLHWARYKSLTSQPYSYRRDTLRIMELDSMKLYASRVDKEHIANIDFDSTIKEILKKKTWVKGNLMLKFQDGYNYFYNGEYMKSLKTLEEVEDEYKRLYSYPHY